MKLILTVAIFFVALNCNVVKSLELKCLDSLSHKPEPEPENVLIGEVWFI